MNNTVSEKIGGRRKRTYQILDLYTGNIMRDLSALEIREITGIYSNHICKYAKNQLAVQRRYVIAYDTDEFKEHKLKIDENEVMTDEWKEWFTKEWNNIYSTNRV